MAKNVKLLLVENVDSLGIVGDIVNVRVGYARNFLMPRELATTPSDDLVNSLAAKRADAEKMLAAQRSEREKTAAKLQGVELELIRSCNDQGVLYGAITQQEVATQLSAQGMPVKARDVRLPGAIKRVDKYEVHVKLDSDLDAVIKLNVKPDRELQKDAVDEGRADAKAKAKADGTPVEPGKEGEARPERAERGERPERGERRNPREDREDKREQAMRKRADLIETAIASDKARVVGWGKKEESGTPGGEAASAEPKARKSEGKKADKGDKADKGGKTKGDKAKK